VEGAAALLAEATVEETDGEDEDGDGDGDRDEDGATTSGPTLRTPTCPNEAGGAAESPRTPVSARRRNFTRTPRFDRRAKR
jgi:hypothetical protein